MRRWRWRAQRHALLRCLQGNATLHTAALHPIIGQQLQTPSFLNRTGEERLLCKSVMLSVILQTNGDTLHTSAQLEDTMHDLFHPLEPDENEVQDVLYALKNEVIFATLETTSGTPDSLMQVRSRMICDILCQGGSKIKEKDLQPFVKCLSTDLVERVLNQMTDMKMIEQFFYWAAKQVSYKHDIFVYNTFLKKLSLTKNSSAVWDLLKTMRQEGCPPTGTTFAIIIQNYIEAGDTPQYWKAYMDARGLGVKLDAHIYINLMQVLFDSGSVTRATRVFANMRECFLDLDTEIWSMVIRGLFKNKRMGDAEKFFDKMKSNGCIPNADIYNAMIVGFSESNNPEKVIALYDSMQKHGCKPITCTYNTTIKAYCSLDRFAEADGLISNMQDAGCELNTVTYNVLLEKLLEKGKTVEAANLFNTMLKAGMADRNSYMIYLSSVRRLGGESKLHFFMEMLFSKYGNHDVEVCNMILQYYCEIGELGKASKYLNEDFIRLSTPNNASYTLVIDAFCKSRDFSAAISLLSSMDERGCKATGSTYEPVIVGLCKDSKESEALRLFQGMNEKGIEASPSTCHQLFHSLSDAGLTDGAIEVCHYITESRLVVDRLTVLAFVKCLSKSNRLQEANGLVRKMMNQSCLSKRSRALKHCLMHMMHGNFDEVEKYLRKQLPNIISYSAMLAGACKQGKLDKAKLIFSQMKEQECAPNLICYTTLITGLLKSRDGLMECVELYEEMLERGVVPFGEFHNFLMLEFCRAKQQDVIMRLGKLIIAKGLSMNRGVVSYLQLAPESSELKKLYHELNDSNCLVESDDTDNKEEVEVELDGGDSE